MFYFVSSMLCLCIQLVRQTMIVKRTNADHCMPVCNDARPYTKMGTLCVSAYIVAKSSRIPTRTVV